MTISRKISVWLMFILCSLPVQSDESAIPKTQPAMTPQFTAQIDQLNELSARRRINTFFNNEQSIFYGLKKGFVNVGKGNMTFVRRDLVAPGRMPIVIARVYDSNLVDDTMNTDFSPGWQLSLAETIAIKDGGTLLYRDDSGVMNTFDPATVGFKVNPAQNSDVKAVGFNAQGLIQIDYLTGWSKHFQQFGDLYRLVNIADNNGNQLHLTYTDNRLSGISAANHRQVDIKRDQSGRIIRVTDDSHRAVNYHYDKNALLSRVDDLASHQWRYTYHRNKLLAKVIDPLGQATAKFSFHQSQKT